MLIKYLKTGIPAKIVEWIIKIIKEEKIRKSKRLS